MKLVKKDSFLGSSKGKKIASAKGLKKIKKTFDRWHRKKNSKSPWAEKKN